MMKKKNIFALAIMLIITMLLAGCGEHECAICGEKSDRAVKIEGKHIDLCESCYREYIEIQHLFSEISDD